MSLRAHYQPYQLDFRFEAGTSRGVLTQKTSWFIKIYDTDQPELVGMGECGPLAGLSVDDRPDFEAQLQQICLQFNRLDLEIFSWNIPIILSQLIDSPWPSIRCGFEMALFDYLNGGQRVVFENNFSTGQRSLPINGLVWMGSFDFMLQQVEAKIEAGFDTIKIKVGAIDFAQECALLAHIRKHFTSREITIRLDANGAFDAQNALHKLDILADFEIHSIEQPIKPKQKELMAELCQTSPIAIALDEELIGVADYVAKKNLLKTLQPKYIILKPTLLGGFEACNEWIEIAQRLGIDWWVTSALESNIGLSAIAQYTANFNNTLPQGLGTGQLYHNNINSPLMIQNGHLHYDHSQSWDLEILNHRSISTSAS